MLAFVFCLLGCGFDLLHDCVLGGCVVVVGIARVACMGCVVEFELYGWCCVVLCLLGLLVSGCFRAGYFVCLG